MDNDTTKEMRSFVLMFVKVVQCTLKVKED